MHYWLRGMDTPECGRYISLKIGLFQNFSGGLCRLMCLRFCEFYRHEWITYVGHHRCVHVKATGHHPRSTSRTREPHHQSAWNYRSSQLWRLNFKDPAIDKRFCSNLWQDRAGFWNCSTPLLTDVFRSVVVLTSSQLVLVDCWVPLFELVAVLKRVLRTFRCFWSHWIFCS